MSAKGTKRSEARSQSLTPSRSRRSERMPLLGTKIPQGPVDVLDPIEGAHLRSEDAGGKLMSTVFENPSYSLYCTIIKQGAASPSITYPTRRGKWVSY